jgi:hypothetical protein
VAGDDFIDCADEFCTGHDGVRSIGVPSSLTLLGAVEGQFAVGNASDVATVLEKLHDLFSGACHRGPSRSGVRILLQPANIFASDFEIDPAQTLFAGEPDWISAVADADRFGIVDQSLPPDVN